MIEHAWFAGTLLASVAVKVNEVPPPVGVPLSTPVLEFKLRPVGIDPDVMDHASGAYPPDAVTVALYTLPRTPCGNGHVLVIDGAT